MSEQSCGTCAKYDNAASCNLTDLPTEPGRGAFCRAYRPKGQRTVRVRVAVCVDEQGRWDAIVWPNAHDSDTANAAAKTEDVRGRKATFYVEADIPIHESVTVEGEVDA